MNPLPSSPNYDSFNDIERELPFLSALLTDIDLIFEINGMEMVPSYMRYMLVAQFVTCPIWLLVILWAVGAFDDPPPKKPSKKSKQEME